MKKTTPETKSNTDPLDPRKNPRPGYDEKNPESKKDIQDTPSDKNAVQ